MTIGGVVSALFYVSPNQINARIDPSVTPGKQTVVVTSPAGTSTGSITVNASAPAVFSLKGTGTGDGAILNAVSFNLGPFSASSKGSPTFLAIFATGLDLSSAPTVTVGGVPVAVLYAGPSPCCMGLQQINVQLTDSLAGAGRVEVVIQSGGNTSNVIEVSLVPNAGQGPFPPHGDNQARARELSAIAYVPGASLVLVTDENDDVVRVVDVSQKAVVRTIVLPAGSRPIAVAVNGLGSLAVVAERDTGEVAILDLAAFRVTTEVAVGSGPCSVAISGTQAVVVNEDSDSVTVVDLTSNTALKTISVGRGPRGVATAAGLAWVTNEDDGTVSQLSLASLNVTNTFNLGANVRPRSIQLIPSLSVALITEPSAGPNGHVFLLNLVTGAVISFDVNLDRSGGSSDVAVNGVTAYFADQTGGSVTVAPIALLNGTFTFTPAQVKVDLGPRAVAVDTHDNLLVVANQGSGTLVLVDLTSNTVVGRINGVSSENESANDDHDNHNDRAAANLPVITSLAPAQASAGSTFVLTIVGSNLSGATGLSFLIPTPGAEQGRGMLDPGFTASNIQINAAGTQLTATVSIAGNTGKGDRVAVVSTPNGDSSFKPLSADTFTVK